jgi:hypothetical protein
VSPQSQSRTQTCSRADARTRLQHAQKFLEVSRLIVEPRQDLEYASAAAALAVLAGIAASDAACCHALGRRSRGQDHRHATQLLEQVEPDGRDAAHALVRLLNLRDQAHYGLFDVSGSNLEAALRQTEALVTFAIEILRR